MHKHIDYHMLAREQKQSFGGRNVRQESETEIFDGKFKMTQRSLWINLLLIFARLNSVPV